MKRSINFSIFRRKEGPQRAHSNEHPDRPALLERLAGRMITIKEGDLTPVADGVPPLDWKTVNGQITLAASAIEGLLEGRARITAQHLKGLDPAPIGSEIRLQTLAILYYVKIWQRTGAIIDKKPVPSKASCTPARVRDGSRKRDAAIIGPPIDRVVAALRRSAGKTFRADY